jgi:lipopolysaccharide biosynthesis protein
MNKSLCIFSHFSTANYIPFYVQLYVLELAKHFQQVIVVTNQRAIKNPEDLSKPNISIKQVSNQGYDFGMYYKILSETDLGQYSEIALVNDSNILFGKLDPIINWGKKQGGDFWGLYDSHTKPKFMTTTGASYHLQSHFMVLKKEALALLPDFFRITPIEAIMAEQNPKKVREMVIEHWEIGLSQYLIKNGLQLKSYVDSKEFCKKHHLEKETNLSLEAYDLLVKNNIPLLKKKIVTSLKIKNWFKPSAIKLVNKYYQLPMEKGPLLLELKALKRNYLLAKLGLN